MVWLAGFGCSSPGSVKAAGVGFDVAEVDGLQALFDVKLPRFSVRAFWPKS